MDRITVSYDADQKEFAAAYREYMASAQISNLKEPVVMALAMGISLAFLIRTHGNPAAVTVFAAAALIVMVRLHYLFIKPMILYKRIPEEFRRVVYLFSGDGIVMRFRKGEMNVNWKTFSDVLETKNNFFLIQPDKGYTLIPKRSFRTEEDARRFRELLIRSAMKLNIM